MICDTLSYENLNISRTDTLHLSSCPLICIFLIMRYHTRGLIPNEQIERVFADICYRFPIVTICGISPKDVIDFDIHGY